MSIIRDATIKAKKYLNTDEMLIFVGARQAGKTTILKQLKDSLEQAKNNCYFLNLDDPEYLELLNKHPKNLFKIFSISLEKRSFIFIDEVQYLNNPSNFLKYIFDEYKGKVKLIVSGSSAFYIDKKFKDSLAGRKKIFNVHTLSFEEFLRFKKEEQLSKKNLKKISLDEKNKISLYYREFMLFGGYPRVVLAPLKEKREVLREIAYSYIKRDIYEANIRQEEIFYKLFKILASQIGNLVNTSELANTLNVSKTAIDHYLYVMRKSFHLHLVNPFFKNIRKEITKMPKIFFLDLGLRNFFVNNFEAYETRADKGELLENATFRQLIEKYNFEDINFWRTTTQKELDFVVNNMALEVKASPNKLKEKNYQLFFESYPMINCSVVSIDSEIEQINKHPILNVWEV